MKDETPDQREQRFEALLLESARAAADYDAADEEMDYGAEQELSERQALRRVKGFSTQLQDISEAEYRELQLERVVLVGVWTEGSIENAENSLTELRALAETAGSEVLDGLIQRRDKPDPATYIGSGKVQELREVVDTVIVLDNNRLVDIAGQLPMEQAFAVANELTSTMIKGIVETITLPSLINLDYADVSAIMKNGDVAVIGVGESDTTARVDEVDEIATGIDYLYSNKEMMHKETKLVSLL
jgi:hypothetical protein